jgi:hypothetical protein
MLFSEIHHSQTKLLEHSLRTLGFIFNEQPNINILH